MKALWTVLLFFGSCVTLSAPEREAILNIDLWESAVDLPAHDVLGTLRGVACQGGGRSASEEEARIDLRIKAVKKKSDAVINVLCREHGATVVHCIICTGEAIRYNTKEVL